MKTRFQFVTVCMLFFIACSCSKSNNIANANKNEFGDIKQLDSIDLIFFNLSNSSGITDTVYCYFQYNSEGLPISKSGGIFPGYTYYFSKLIKDTLIYLDNHTIEMRSFMNGISSDKKSLFTFNNGYLVQKIDLRDDGSNVFFSIDTSTYNYNSSHQLISIITTSGSSYATRTDYIYGINTIKDSTYTFDVITQKQIYPQTGGSLSVSEQSLGTKSNPYYKQEWLKMWPEFFGRTLSPFSNQNF